MPKQSTTPIKKAGSKKTIKEVGVTIDVLDTDGKVTAKLSLPKEIFAVSVKPALLAQAVRVYLANQRQGTISTKTRSMVTGSTRKIYRQKGTGRARHGDIKSPIFIGGGIAHGPHPRDFSLDLSKQMKRKALFGALTAKLKEGSLIAVSGVEKIEKKTKDMMNILNNLKLINDKEKKRQTILMVVPRVVENIMLAGRNIEGISFTSANLLTTYQVLRNDRLVFLKDSFAVLEKTYLKKN